MIATNHHQFSAIFNCSLEIFCNFWPSPYSSYTGNLLMWDDLKNGCWGNFHSRVLSLTKTIECLKGIQFAHNIDKGPQSGLAI